MTPHFITALATPMHEDDSLYVESLEALIEFQIANGISNFLAGGTMGCMQLLPDATYRDLMEYGLRFTAGRGQFLAGIGDASFARTRDRLEFVNTLPVDGVVALAPFLMPFSQDELLDYYTALADLARAPLYLYDLPGLTRHKISFDLAIKLSKHPNIAGIKCSDEPGYARQLRDEAGENFRVIVAAPNLTDVLLRSGFAEHLDGIYCACPGHIAAIGAAAQAADWQKAAEHQRVVSQLLRLVVPLDVWRPFTVLMHALSIPGRFKPRPHCDWDGDAAAEFLARAETQDLLLQLQTPVPV